MQGVSEQYPEVRKWNVQSGSFFTDADVRSAARVIVVGQTIADNLFAGNGSGGADTAGGEFAVSELWE